MSETFIRPEGHPAWNALLEHAERLRTQSLRTLFEQDDARFGRLSRRADGLLLDLSKQRLDEPALAALLLLAEESGLARGIETLFNGEKLNFTEGRAALHMAMRGGCAAPDAEALALRQADARVREFARTLRDGKIMGSTGLPIRHVVNIGIGGSDLGPRMATEALGGSAAGSTPTVRFVANIDPRELDEALAEATPGETLFILSSKSFSTAETLANANTARRWLQDALGNDFDAAAHFAAVSNATDKAQAFGVAAERVFPLPEWVGGRYSVWSAIGLPLLIAIGEDAFDRFLAGARTMDRHFRTAAPTDNLPVLAALAGIWNTNFLGIGSCAVLPYAHGLRSFPAWLQQLEMESNGKAALRDGSVSGVHTSPVVWGGAGTVGQHAFHQLFYQGTREIALDFIVPVGGTDPRQQALVDNALAQSAALMLGRDLEQARASLHARGLPVEEIERLAPHLVCRGDQPSSTLLLPRLDPFSLGQLLALHEHRVFVQGWIWGIDSFDQYGVELGKEMARRLAASDAAAADSSTAGLQAAAAAMRVQP